MSVCVCVCVCVSVYVCVCLCVSVCLCICCISPPLSLSPPPSLSLPAPHNVSIWLPVVRCSFTFLASKHTQPHQNNRPSMSDKAKSDAAMASSGADGDGVQDLTAVVQTLLNQMVRWAVLCMCSRAVLCCAVTAFFNLSPFFHMFSFFVIVVAFCRLTARQVPEHERSDCR